MKKINCNYSAIHDIIFYNYACNAKSEVTIHLVEDKLATYFRIIFHMDDKKTIYAFCI